MAQLVREHECWLGDRADQEGDGDGEVARVDEREAEVGRNGEQDDENRLCKADFPLHTYVIGGGR